MIKRIINKLIYLIIYLMYNRPLPPPSDKENIYLKELKSEIQHLPWSLSDNPVPSESVWLSNMNQLKELVLTQNPREFLRWDVIIKTMFTAGAEYSLQELNYLKSQSDWRSRWKRATQEVSVGYPPPYLYYPKSTGNLIQHAYHIANFENITNTRIQNMSLVFEFGGGYGSMCRLLFNLDFRGKYIIYDLPAFSALQKYYLKTIGLPVLTIEQFNKSSKGVVCLSDLEELKLINGESAINNSLFIATWSISESPIHIRNSLLPFINNYTAFLMVYQERFREVNNVDYFHEWKINNDHINWHNWQIEHIHNSYYLIGIKKLCCGESSDRE